MRSFGEISLFGILIPFDWEAMEGVLEKKNFIAVSKKKGESGSYTSSTELRHV